MLIFDVPRFDGEDYREITRWINRVEQYFELHKLYDDKEKIYFASLHIDKEASDWFLWWHSKCQWMEWETFRKNFFMRFQNIKEKEVFFKLTQLQQVGMVEELFNELHMLSTCVIDLLDDHLLQISISRLKEDIRNELKLIDIKDVEKL